MSTYILYNKSTGDIVHVHRELFMSSEKTTELSEEDLLQEIGELLPEGIDVGILTTDESLQPKRGYRYYVDLRTNKLMLMEKPPKRKER